MAWYCFRDGGSERERERQGEGDKEGLGGRQREGGRQWLRGRRGRQGERRVGSGSPACCACVGVSERCE
jgi:hypothetical protein